MMQADPSELPPGWHWGPASNNLDGQGPHFQWVPVPKPTRELLQALDEQAERLGEGISLRLGERYYRRNEWGAIVVARPYPRGA